MLPACDDPAARCDDDVTSDLSTLLRDTPQIMDSLGSLESQKVLHSTGSFTGYRPLQNLGSDYLTATTTTRQPLCANKEGWGPLSPHRYDFTPCFIDVWILSVAVFGLVLGSGAVWYLKRKKQVVGTEKNFHFWLKQVCPGSALCSSA